MGWHSSATIPAVRGSCELVWHNNTYSEHAYVVGDIEHKGMSVYYL